MAHWHGKKVSWTETHNYGWELINRFLLRTVPYRLKRLESYAFSSFRFFLKILLILFSPRFCVLLQLCHTLHTKSALQMSSIMKRRKRLNDWRHFTKQDEYSAVCRPCSAVLPCKYQYSTNMLKYLSTQHETEYKLQRS